MKRMKVLLQKTVLETYIREDSKLYSFDDQRRRDHYD